MNKTQMSEPSVTPAEDVTGTDVGKIPCDDAISRQAALEQINCWIGSGEYRYTNATDYLSKRIKAIPSVTPAEKVGHWYKKSHEICYTCDQCRSTNASGTKYNFCPHCGAKMEVQDESDG